MEPEIEISDLTHFRISNMLLFPIFVVNLIFYLLGNLHHLRNVKQESNFSSIFTLFSSQTLLLSLHA